MKITFSFSQWLLIKRRPLNKSFDNVKNLKHLGKYLGATLSNQNCMHEVIKSRIKMGNACYHLVKNPLSSCSISHNIQIKIHWTIILPVALHGCEICSLTLKDHDRENTVQGLGGREQQVTGANYIMSTFMNGIPLQILFAWLNQGEWDGKDIGICEGEEKYIQGLGEET